MKQKKKVQEVESKRPVDTYFEELDANFQDPTNRIIQIIFLPLLFFGVMGCIWMIPFPQFEFLVKLNWHTFLNWGSFFIAIIIYFYLKLSATLSYAILFSIGAMSFFYCSVGICTKKRWSCGDMGMLGDRIAGVSRTVSR